MTSRPTTAPATDQLSPGARRFLARAREQWSRHQFDAAEQSLTNVLALAPDCPDALRMLGMCAQRRGDHARATRCFQQVLPVWPNDAELHIGLGIALCEQADTDAGIGHLRKACSLAPGLAMAWFNLGEALARNIDTREAKAMLQRALEADPAHLPARLSLARVLANLGEIELAVGEFREVLRRDAGSAEAWFGLSNLNTVHFDTADTALLGHALAQHDFSSREYELLGFTFAKALEDQGQYARAFDVFGLANASRRKRIRWDGAGEHRRAAAIREAFSSDMPAPLQENLGQEVILITSIPRSGSTLVEQILASHPMVEGANEIRDMREVIDAETVRRHSAFPLWTTEAAAADWNRLGREYLARTARWRKSRPRFTDKSLVTWYLVGAALAMLPAARVVVVRRDPVETCLGCYRQCFSEASGFASNLDETADYCADFLHLTRFWLERYPDRVFDLPYETLVSEPEATIRHLLAFCDLPFDPACLDYHRTPRAVMSLPSAAQVRQPLRRDTARSARYGDKLDALRERLRKAGVSV